MNECDTARLSQVVDMILKMTEQQLADALTMAKLTRLAKMTHIYVGHCKTKLAVAVELKLELTNQARE